jgi:hypothetical protein
MIRKRPIIFGVALRIKSDGVALKVAIPHDKVTQLPVLLTLVFAFPHFAFPHDGLINSLATLFVSQMVQ